MEMETASFLGDDLFLKRLKSGLTVAVLRKPGYAQATARFATHYGSVHNHFIDPVSQTEIRAPEGIAHFLEHKLFESEEGDVSDRFSELGAESNAYTTQTQTVYYFDTTVRFAECLTLLLDFVQTPWFTDESVAKEQGIIEQEIRMYRDDPQWRSNANLLEALYWNHPVRVDIAGTAGSIKRITKEMLYLCHRAFYRPGNMLLVAIGDLDPEAVMATADRSLADHQHVQQTAAHMLFREEPPAVKERRCTARMPIGQPILRLGFKDKQVGLGATALLKQDLLTTMVLEAQFGRGTETYSALYEEGLIDQRFGFEYIPEQTFGFTQIFGPTRAPAELEERLLSELARVQERGLKPNDFERAKRKLIGRTLQFMNDMDAVAHFFIDAFFKGISVHDVLPVAEALTLEAANQRLREHLDLADFSVSVVHP